MHSGESLLLHFARHLRLASTSSDVESVKIAVEVNVNIVQLVNKMCLSQASQHVLTMLLFYQVATRMSLNITIEEVVWKLVRRRI